jgi:hypothetical protein
VSGHRILPVSAGHRADWERLYAGYAAFYRVTQTAEMRDQVWRWLMDPAHEVQGLIAEDDAGRAMGLAHYRPFARPLSATIGGFLDDLFVGTRGARRRHCRCADRGGGGGRPAPGLERDPLGHGGRQLPRPRRL